MTMIFVLDILIHFLIIIIKLMLKKKKKKKKIKLEKLLYKSFGFQEK